METDLIMEQILEVCLRERRFQLWNAIQELYSIPEEVKAAIYRWIVNDCNYIPKITKRPNEPVVLRANT
jgi:hypothetical protein